MRQRLQVARRFQRCTGDFLKALLACSLLLCWTVVWSVNGPHLFAAAAAGSASSWYPQITSASHACDAKLLSCKHASLSASATRMHSSALHCAVCLCVQPCACMHLPLRLQLLILIRWQQDHKPLPSAHEPSSALAGPTLNWQLPPQGRPQAAHARRLPSPTEKQEASHNKTLTAGSLTLHQHLDGGDDEVDQGNIPRHCSSSSSSNSKAAAQRDDGATGMMGQ